MCYRALVELALAQGINYIDLNGPNSPNRADYKHGWASEPRLFFNVTREALK